jgi:multidrug efflux pump subunit AcrA (membrane-fusion protein)
VIAGLVALLVGRGIASWLAMLIVYGVVGLLALGAVGGVVYWAHSEWNMRVAEPYRIEGDVRTTAKLQPKIDQLTKERDQARADVREALAANATLQDSVGTLETKLKDANANIVELKTLAEKARAQARKAIAEIQARVKRDADEIARLTAIANGPPIADACAKADEYLTKLANWRRGL